MRYKRNCVTRKRPVNFRDFRENGPLDLFEDMAAISISIMPEHPIMSFETIESKNGRRISAKNSLITNRLCLRWSASNRICHWWSVFIPTSQIAIGIFNPVLIDSYFCSPIHNGTSCKFIKSNVNRQWSLIKRTFYSNIYRGLARSFTT